MNVMGSKTSNMPKEKQEDGVCGNVMLEKVRNLAKSNLCEFENRVALDDNLRWRCGPMPFEHGRCPVCFLNARTITANFEHWIQKHIVEDRNWSDIPEVVREGDEPTPIYCLASSPRAKDNRWALGEPPQSAVNTPLADPSCYTKFFWQPRLENKFQKFSLDNLIWTGEEEAKACGLLAAGPRVHDMRIKNRDEADRQMSD